MAQKNYGIYDSVNPILNLTNTFFKDLNKTNAGKFFNGHCGVDDTIKSYSFDSNFKSGQKKNLWPDLVDYRVNVRDPETKKYRTDDYDVYDVDVNINKSTQKLFEDIRNPEAFHEVVKEDNTDHHTFINRAANEMKNFLTGLTQPTGKIAVDTKYKDDDWYYSSIKTFDFDPRTAINSDTFVKDMKELLYKEGILLHEAYIQRLYRGDESELFRAFVENRLYRFGARDKSQLGKIWEFIELKNTSPIFYVQVVSYMTCLLALNEKPYDTKVDKHNTVDWMILEFIKKKNMGKLRTKQDDDERDFFAAASLVSRKYELIEDFKKQLLNSKCDIIRYQVGKAVVLDQDFGHNFSSLFVEAFGCRNPRVFNCFVEILSDFARMKGNTTNIEECMKGENQEMHERLSQSFRMLGGWILFSADESIKHGECSGIQSVIWPRGRSLYRFQDSSSAFSTIYQPKIEQFPETYGVDFLLALSQTRQFHAEDNDKWFTMKEPYKVLILDFVSKAAGKENMYGEKLDEGDVFQGSYKRAVCRRD